MGVLTEHVDGVAIVSFNRPERHNALDDETIEAWRVAVASALDDPSTRCLLLKGEGPSFSSGRDLGQLGQRAKGETDAEFVAAAQAANLRLVEAPVPVVAAMQGHAIGGAFETALCADIRLAADDLSCSLPEIRSGLVPDTGASVLLTALAGPSRAKVLMMTGQPIDAATALAWGIVDEVVPAESLDARARTLGRQLAAAPGRAVRAAKRLVDAAWLEQLEAGMKRELEAQVELFGTADHAEARAAFRDGREPRFEGR